MRCHIRFSLTCSLGLKVVFISLEVEHHLKLLDHRPRKAAKRKVHVKSQPASPSSSLLPALVQFSRAITDAWGA